MLAVCIAGFTFGVYYGDEISLYFRNTVILPDKSLGIMFRTFLNFYYDSVKLQLLIFLCSFTVFSAPAGTLTVLYGSIILGSSTMAMATEYSVSGYLLYLTVLPYTFAGAVSLYIYVEMVCRAYSHSLSARHSGAGFSELALSRETRSYIAGLLLLSAFILISEICRFIIIVLVN
jgi:hypothetical protein